jgi:hypothetical protein
MTALTCGEVRDSAAEFALDILEPEQRSAMAAHLIRCPACRAEVESMAAVGSRLLELVPGTEPPLGFDERVLAQVSPAAAIGLRRRRRRPRLLAGLAAAAAAVALAFGSAALFGGSTASHSQRAVLTADFIQGGRNVGEVYAYSEPSWLSMVVHGAQGAQKITCELVDKDGAVTVVGSFDLVDGSGSWGAPDQAPLAGVSGARLVDSSGQVIATATFRE